MDLNAILVERLAILGGTGSGKSYTARGLAERVLDGGGRLLITPPGSKDCFGYGTFADCR